MQEQFGLLQDLRTDQQKDYHGLVMNYLTSRNLSNMNILLSLKRKVRYIPSQTFQIDLGNGWNCTITDNQVNSKHTIFTCHGCPGDEKDWAGLESEMKNQIRWVNIVLPGFDGKDERRGNYKGNCEDILELILRVMKKLGVEKIITCGHSMGSFVFSIFLQRYPEKVEGFVTVAGVVDMWYVGLMTFYNQTVVCNGFRKPGFDLQTMALDNQFRAKMTKQTNERSRSVNFAGVAFPELLPCELFAYTKFVISFRDGITTLFKINQTLAPHLLKVYLFGLSDPIQNFQRTQAMMYRRVYGEMRPDTSPSFLDKFKLVRREIVQQCHDKHQCLIDIENIQSNFVFHFPETGHNVHKRRPGEIAQILNVYVTVLDQLGRGEELRKSKL